MKWRNTYNAKFWLNSQTTNSVWLNRSSYIPLNHDMNRFNKHHVSQGEQNNANLHSVKLTLKSCVLKIYVSLTGWLQNM